MSGIDIWIDNYERSKSDGARLAEWALDHR